MCKVQIDPAGLEQRQSSNENNISSSSDISFSPFSMLNRGLQLIPHEQQSQHLQESVSRESDLANVDLVIKNVLSHTQSQVASTMDPLQSFVNFNSESHNQQSCSTDLSTVTKKRWMEALLY